VFAGIDREEQKLLREIKMAAKRGDKGSAKFASMPHTSPPTRVLVLLTQFFFRHMAKEIIRSRKAKERLYKSKAELNSISMHLQQNLGLSFCVFSELFTD
jgi:charged multivesicular body protein 3